MTEQLLNPVVRTERTGEVLQDERTATRSMPGTTPSPAAATTTISGVYEAGGPTIAPFTREEMRLDVDGPYPLMAVSGTASAGLQTRVDWVARNLTASPTTSGTQWSGRIFYKDGNTALLPYTKVTLRMQGSSLRATFAGGGAAPRTIDLSFRGNSFRPVEFEYDAVQGVTPVTSIQTNAHPDRPASLPAESLSIETVYQRAGFQVTRTNADSIVPLAGAGANARWSDAEMHDAMQVYFSRFANRPQWALWTFFAGLHEDGPGLGGIMFDDLGPNHRQGTSLFLNSFISRAPTGDANPTAWVRRTAFWTAVHEMGHSFNLAHAWDKGRGRSWIPLTGGYDQLTFMNYPFLFRTGQQSNANTIAFFRQFDFRFTNDELLFLRHAPERFVQMGNAAWFDNHGFNQANVSPASQFQFELRVNRNPRTYEYLEPVVVELKLTNRSQEPCLIPEQMLRATESMTLVVQRAGRETRQFVPYASYCRQGTQTVLQPGESVYESMFVSADRCGWLLAEPGNYTLQMCLGLPNEDLISNALPLRIASPRHQDEEYLAQDYFSDEVGRVLAFDGSRYLTQANDVLLEVANRLPQRRAAVHAGMALAMPATREYKMLEFNERTDGSRGRIRVEEQEEEATQPFQNILTNPDAAMAAAETLGNIDYKFYTERYCQMLEKTGEKRQAQEVRQVLYETLVDRHATGNVLDEVQRTLNASEEEEEDRRPQQRRSPRSPRSSESRPNQQQP